MNFSGFTLLSHCVTAAHCVQCPQLLYVVSQKDRGVRASVCVCVVNARIHDGPEPTLGIKAEEPERKKEVWMMRRLRVGGGDRPSSSL